jgi:hypothetical protein
VENKVDESVKVKISELLGRLDTTLRSTAQLYQMITAMFAVHILNALHALHRRAMLI